MLPEVCLSLGLEPEDPGFRLTDLHLEKDWTLDEPRCFAQPPVPGAGLQCEEQPAGGSITHRSSGRVGARWGRWQGVSEA